MIVVTGANGQLGSQIVAGLLERVPSDEIVASVRDPQRASGLGVSVRRGDFDDPDSLDAAFAGASQVLVVSVDELGDAGVARNTAAVDAAYRAGAERVVYTSHQAANADSPFAPARDHAAVEAHLERTGRPFTALRNGYYSTSLLFHVGDAARSGELVAPADGPVSWTTRADLAEAAAAILSGERTFDGPTPPLTAADAVDLEQVAAMLSEVSGRAVRRVVADDEEWVAGLVEHGTPAPLAHLLLGTYEASRSGAFAVTDPALAELIGRETEGIGLTLAASQAS